MSEMNLYEMNKSQLINKCNELTITKISNKNKKQLVELITNKLQNVEVKKVITRAEESSIDYNKYANIIIRAFKKYKNMWSKSEVYFNTSDEGWSNWIPRVNIGLGKWLIIIDDTKFPQPELFWLGGIVGVTGFKLWKEQRENYKDNYSITTTCLCIYCGVHEKILTPEKQYNWILHIGKKLSKSPYLNQISMGSKIFFKENIKTSQGIYSFNSTNVCNLSVNMFNNKLKLDENLIDEIGEYLGLEMWNKRDKTKEYDFQGAREEKCLPGDGFVEGNIIKYNGIRLLVYQNMGCSHGSKSLYTLNLSTLNPTKNSKIQKLLSRQLFEKIKYIKST